MRFVPGKRQKKLPSRRTLRLAEERRVREAAKDAEWDRPMTVEEWVAAVRAWADSLRRVHSGRWGQP